MRYSEFQTAIREALMKSDQAVVNRLFLTDVKCAYCGNSTFPTSPKKDGPDRTIRCALCRKMWMKIMILPGGGAKFIEYGP